MAQLTLTGTVSVMEIEHGTLDGPWIQGFWLRTELVLRSKSNFRRSSRPSRDGWDSMRRFEEDLALLLRAALPEGWECGDASAPVPTRPSVLAVVCASSLLDVPNYPKSVMDAAEGVVFHTDAAVAYCAALGVRARTGGLLLGFARLEPGAPLGEITTAATALTTTAAALFEVPHR